MYLDIPDDPSNCEKIKKALLSSEKNWELTFDAIPDLIAILDNNHRIIKINKAMAEKIHRSPEDCTGSICYEVVHNTDKPPENCPHLKLLQDCQEHTSELKEENIGGYFIVTASPIHDNGGNVLGSVHIAHNITHRKEMEDQLKKTLKEKETLIKEIHHRVKNNLTIISSLLSLQSRYIKDKNTLEMFRESQNRTKSMALIHEKLYASQDLKRINFKEYLESLANDLYRTYTENTQLIKLIMDLDDVMLDVETSIPLGLILNELLTNSLRHAFPDGRNGEIHIELHSTNKNEFNLIISDNGTGFPENLDFKNTESLGMRLVNSLTEQINGEIELDKTTGTKFIITFKDVEFS